MAPSNPLKQIFVTVDGAWSSWSGYGLCSVSCGGGKQSRSRTCTNPKPANGGLDCPGGASELTDCNVDACPTVPAGQYQQVNHVY